MDAGITVIATYNLSQRKTTPILFRAFTLVAHRKGQAASKGERLEEAHQLIQATC